MHTPKARTCAYSGNRIDKSEIAITIQPSRSSNNNEWIKLTSIRPLVRDLETICEGDYKGSDLGNTDRVSYMRDALTSSIGTPRGHCVICDTYDIDGKRERSEANPSIISFTFRGDNDPWVHGHCAEGLIDSFERVFNLDQVSQSEIISQMV